MGKTSKWLKSFLTGKKEKEKCDNGSQSSPIPIENKPTTPISVPQTTPPPKEKRRWSFRRSSAAAATPPSKDSNSAEAVSTTPSKIEQTESSDAENEVKKHAMAVAVATAAAADAAVAAEKAAAAVIRLTAAAIARNGAIEEAAAIRIQSVFRSYLARKALCALRGLVKLQALVRGHLVRKQATTTLRCMQALVTVQARALAQRIRQVEDGRPANHRPSPHRRSVQENRLGHSYEMDRGMEENIKIVEMDLGDAKGSVKSRNSYSIQPLTEKTEQHRFSIQNRGSFKQESYHQISPAPSNLTDMSPRACSGHFEDYSFSTAQSSPQCYSAMSKPDPCRVPFAFPRPDYEESLTSYDYPLFPNYMANTESSKAKVRSQSAPKQRPESFERQPSSRRRASVEGRNVPRAVRMQRSSSHVGATAHNYQYPWSLKLDKSTVSLKDSECGSTSTVLTNTNYCRSLVAYDPHRNRF